jgi:hypothetical protein
MDKFLDIYNHQKLNQEAINNLNRSITHNRIEAAIAFQKRKVQDLANSQQNSVFKEELIPTLLKVFMKYKGKEHCLTPSIKPVLNSSQNQTRTHPKQKNYRPIS